MICWRHLTKMVECGADEPILSCPACLISADHDDNIECRADLFKSLVAAESSYSQTTCEGTSAHVVESALATMDEIERRVEAGALFGKGGESDG